MNILFVINYAGNAGTEKYVDNLERIFTGKGDNCFLAYNTAGKLSSDFEKRNVPSICLDLTKKHMKASAQKLAQFCRKNRIDVIHAQFPVENIIAIKSLRYYSSPRVVFTSHLSDIQGFKWKILNRIYTQENHRIICVCDEGRKNLIESGIREDKITVIYNGVEPENGLHEFSEDGVFRMIIMARYAKEKGLDFLLDVLSLVKKNTEKSFTCTVLGEGPLFDEIKSRAEQRGLGKILIQPGYTDNPKAYLKKSDLYLNTSQSGEAMSFAILEAMNSGLPAVATDVGGNRSLTDNIFKRDDAEGFCRCILSYMNNKEKLTEDSLKAKKKIRKEFDLSMLAEKVRSTYMAEDGK